MPKKYDITFVGHMCYDEIIPFGRQAPHCRRRPFESGSYTGVRGTAQFSLEQGAWVYRGADLPGGIAAAFFLRTMFGTIGLLGATTPGAGDKQSSDAYHGSLIDGPPVSTILGTAPAPGISVVNGALAVGGYIAFPAFWAAPISGASMNPVR